MSRSGVSTVKYKAKDINHTLDVDKLRLDKEKILLAFMVITVLLYFIIIMIPMVSITGTAGFINTLFSLKSTESLSAIGISLMTTAFSVIMTFVLGTPVVFILMNNKKSIFTRLLDMTVNIPAVLPPAVAGLGLLLVFGRNGFIGKILEGFGVEVVFTPLAVILAQFFVASGLYIKVLKTATDAIDPEILEITYVMGAGKIETFLKVVIPMIKKPIIVGLILSWTRALGEFGATIMFAGNVLGKTRTMPLEIYTLMQTDITKAAALATVLFIITFIMLVITKIWLEE
ncbi:ABC transporter permease [Pseudobacteroides cellulosolvens]|uniref:NifC-like ABC-type porter n=1 Tax=Pseudobacteroides cellulosolvens ATCC 35603 = DSM 2933 TaxID=398512 RepID=A0A0L6JW18_9FIRM|nr:ABC transporter permease [Pseudobacteroides cellulosolvens]KNY30061.1 NifC-like ABC-type porter [Pseudobacteroides cellulosolvens ATCC 35603 = DSM 2933]